MIEIFTEKIPILSWADDADEETMRQARNIANLSVAFHHVALMPDAHAGYGMPIGGVLAAKEAVVPNAVGVDIGCGMRAVATDLQGIAVRDLEKIFAEIRSTIPLGFAHHEKPMHWDGFRDAPDIRVVEEEIDSARRQLGTLGGGNHFIELQKSPDRRMRVMIHSGSRNFGLKIAEHFHKTAKKIRSAEGSLPEDPNLAFLRLGTREAGEYLAAMDFAVRFAEENRRLMTETVLGILRSVLGPFEAADEIDVRHNYAARESHFGEVVVVHRKGATSAGKGEPGIVPGSQGTSSCIVRGLGNPDSFRSCSHGAGRRMGRSEAKKSLDLAEELRKMDAAGIVHGMRDRKDLDEAPSAYKDIGKVMRDQRDLAEVVVELKPLLVVKG